MEKNKVTVEIFGEKYALRGDMDTERVKLLAKMVDEEMRAVAKGNHRLPPAKVAVLAALNLANEYLKIQDDYQQVLDLLKNE